MKLTRMLLAGALVLGLSGVAYAHPSARAVGSTTVGLRGTRLGNILVAADGFTLYEFSRDKSNLDNCQNIKGCLAAWPPLTSSGSPRAGRGVNSRLLGTIRLKSGARQITYAGHPLYLYVGDSGPGQTGYVGEDLNGGAWYALNAHGGTVR